MPWLFLVAYTCSGFAGLVYEVTWTRLPTLHLGRTTAGRLGCYDEGASATSRSGRSPAPRHSRWTATPTPREMAPRGRGLARALAP